MKILLTGGAGFLGSHIADSLFDAGHEVVVFDLINSPYLREDQSMVIGDVTNADDVLAAAEGCNVIYHLAAVADIDDAIHNPRATVEVNILGTLNALEAARRQKVDRFVLASSIYVYSSQGSFYRTSKQASEHLVHDYQERFDLPFTVLRFGSLYGPRADRHNSIYRMINQAMKKRKITYSGSGKEVREYIHVVDAANASVDILQKEFENEYIHLMGRERITTGEMMEMIAEMLGGDVAIHTNQGNMTGHYLQTPYSYIPKLGKKLVQHTYIDLGLGLLDCMQAYDGSKWDEGKSDEETD
ncbi:MAG: NAD(P)-dependent oxidoreductase [Alphaproteobacteria bacterium]|nr:NAD(P)-dependent oxidoreductase [Alphaproteobacteria bacterium]